MGFDATLAVLIVSAILFGISLFGSRRRRRDFFRVPWFPWHGLMFLSLTSMVMMAVHLLAIS